MDSPILPILIGGGVLAAVVLGSRRASAQDDDYGDGYGDGYGAGPYLNVPRIPTLPDIGGNEGGAGGYGGDPASGGDDQDYSNIPGGVSLPDIPGREYRDLPAGIRMPTPTGNLRINAGAVPDGEVRVQGYGPMQETGRRAIYDERFSTQAVRQRGLLLDVPAGFYIIAAWAGGRRVSSRATLNVTAGQAARVVLSPL
jgi:hypothetical protein